MKRIEQKNTIKKKKTQASLIVTEIRLNFRFALQITKCMRTAKIGPDLRLHLSSHCRGVGLACVAGAWKQLASFSLSPTISKRLLRRLEQEYWQNLSYLPSAARAGSDKIKANE